MSRSILLSALTLLFAAGGCAHASGGAGEASGPLREAFGTNSPLFSGAVRTGNLVYTSGVIGRSQDGQIQGATLQALNGVRDRLEAAGANLADVVKCTVFMVDIADYAGMNEVYQGFFPQPAPARTALAVLALPSNAQVEVECIAAVR